jgi:hypothetical protein
MPSFFELVKSCATGEAKSYSVAQFLDSVLFKLPPCALTKQHDCYYFGDTDMKSLIPSTDELICCDTKHTKRLWESEFGYIVYDFSFESTFEDYGDRFFDDCFRVYTEREFDYNKFLDNTNDLGFVMEFFMKIGLKRPEEELVKYIRKRFLYFTEEEEPLIYNETFLAVYGEEEEESDLDFSDDELGLESESDVRQMRCTKCGGTEK